MTSRESELTMEEEDHVIQPLNLEIMKPVAQYQQTSVEDETDEEPKTILELEPQMPINYIIETIPPPPLPSSSSSTLIDFHPSAEYYRFSSPVYVTNPPQFHFPLGGAIPIQASFQPEFNPIYVTNYSHLHSQSSSNKSSPDTSPPVFSDD